jgi:hypothetical protein
MRENGKSFLPFAQNSFPREWFPMSTSEFSALLLRFPVAIICSKVPGLPASTVYHWQRGERVPPEWAQRLIADKLGNPADVPPVASGDAIEPKRGRGRPRNYTE